MRTSEAGSVPDVPRRVGLRHDDDWPFSHPSLTMQFAGIPNKGFLVPLSNLYKLLISGGVLPTPYFHTFTVDQQHSRSFPLHNMGSAQIDLAELPAMKSNPKVFSLVYTTHIILIPRSSSSSQTSTAQSPYKTPMTS
jgi:hypothetical protein